MSWSTGKFGSNYLTEFIKAAFSEQMEVITYSKVKSGLNINLIS